MHLGDIYLKSFLAIVGSALAIAICIGALVCWWRRCSKGTALAITLLVWPLLGVPAAYAWHQPLFVAWHKSQNEALPAENCLTYDPSFFRLYATYRMKRAEFDAWVANYPKLVPQTPDDGLFHSDGPRLGLEQPELSDATEPAPNGNQLRVYFKANMMYVSYNAM